MAKRDLFFSSPVMNAAGSLGFAPDPHGPVRLERLGAFVTNPLSYRARSPARPPQVIPFPGGVLVHTGFPNPGLPAAIRGHARHWARAPLPVIVHLLAPGSDRPAIAELAAMLHRLEPLENIMGVEIGLPPESRSSQALALLEGIAGELPVILRLSPQQALELVRSYQAPGEALLGAGASAISLGEPRGALPGREGCLVRGRLYGPANLAEALGAVQVLSAQTAIPVIGGGGVYGPEDVRAMLAAGAVAVQIDTALWRGWVEDR